MNYYERHLGDYARDAGHLTMLEHGAYTLLLDRYYTTEQGIPADQAHRICRARTRDEKEAVDTVLAEFFKLTDGCWVNGRASREVTKMQAKVKAAQENGKLGGRPRSTQPEPDGNPPGFDSVTQIKAHQSPDTRQPENQEAERAAPAAAARAPADADPPEANGQPPTAAGLVCRAMRQAGLRAVNPGDPRLLVLLQRGITEAELVGVATEAVAGGKGWAWVLKVIQARRDDAAAMVAVPAAAPPPGLTVASSAADRTADYLRQQAERGAAAPPRAVLDALKARRATA